MITPLPLSLPLSQTEEIKKLVGNRTGFSACGPTIAGMKCMLLNDHLDNDPEYYLNMKTKADKDGNSYFICVGKTLKGKIVF